MKKLSLLIVTLLVVFSLGTPVFFVRAEEVMDFTDDGDVQTIYGDQKRMSFEKGFQNTLFKSGLFGKEGATGADINSLPTVELLIGKYVQIALSFVGIVFFILIFYSGILWMISLDTPQRITDARRTIIHATVGLLITLAAYALVAQVLDIITKTLPGAGI